MGAEVTSDEVRTASLFLSRAVAEQQIDSVIFAAPQRGAGTTTTTLAVATDLLGLQGLRPLVVEVDPYRSALSEIYPLDPERSLEAVAAEKLKPADAVQRNDEGLALLRSTNGRPSRSLPGGLSRALARVLADTRPCFDIVLVDAPPILEHEAVFEAGRVIPRVILVVEAARSRSQVLERVQRELAVAHIELMGTILNKHRRVIPGWLYHWFAG